MGKIQRIDLVSLPGHAPAIFYRKRNLAKNFLTELCKNLTVEVLSFDTDYTLEINALTDLYAEIGVRLANSIFANHERARLDMKKQEEEMSKKYDFFDDDDDDIFLL